MAKQMTELGLDPRITPPTVKGKRKKLLTIGMAVHRDFPSFAQTMISLLQGHAEIVDQVDFVLVDNDPRSGHGEDCQAWMRSKIPGANYCAVEPAKGPTISKNLVVNAAQTEYVMCIDSHVSLVPGSIAKLLKFLSAVGVTNDLFQGPLVDEMGRIYATHMNPGISGGNFGRWGTYRENGQVIDPADYYEVPMHGMGLFVTRRDTWAGFHTAMTQFGAEEGYIHEKYRVMGRKCWSLPFLKWWHLFRNKSVELTYPISSEHKFRNMLIGWQEVGLPSSILDKYWKPRIPALTFEHIKQNVASLDIQRIPRNMSKPAFLGYPIRCLDEPHNESQSYADFEYPKYYGASVE